MRYIGYKDDEIPESCSIPEAANILGVHENTVRNWIKKKIISAAQVGSEARIGRDALLHLMEQWRERMPIKKSLFTAADWRDFDLADVLAKHLEVDMKDVNEAFAELLDYHHISRIPEPDKGDFSFWVHQGVEPKLPVARIIKRLFEDNHYVRDCPTCGKTMPRLLHAADSPRPKKFWQLKPVLFDEKHKYEFYLWMIWCGKCKKMARFIYAKERG